MCDRRSSRPNLVTRGSRPPPTRPNRLARLDAHRPEVQELDLAAPLADPPLPVEDRPAVVDQDRDRDRDEHRCEKR